MELLPQLAARLIREGRTVLRVWSAGCASGEEPYTFRLLWDHEVAPYYPQLMLHLLATDMYQEGLDRARVACYGYSSVKNLPESWRRNAFVQINEIYCLREPYKRGVEFFRHDVRLPLQAAPFQVILCRNLAFTYFDADLKQEVLDRLYRCLCPDGLLVLGVHEILTDARERFVTISEKLGIYRKKAKGEMAPLS